MLESVHEPIFCQANLIVAELVENATARFNLSIADELLMQMIDGVVTLASLGKPSFFWELHSLWDHNDQINSHETLVTSKSVHNICAAEEGDSKLEPSECLDQPKLAGKQLAKLFRSIVFPFVDRTVFLYIASAEAFHIFSPSSCEMILLERL